MVDYPLVLTLYIQLQGLYLPDITLLVAHVKGFSLRFDNVERRGAAQPRQIED